LFTISESFICTPSRVGTPLTGIGNGLYCATVITIN
jgi:hypothetical protein